MIKKIVLVVLLWPALVFAADQFIDGTDYERIPGASIQTSQGAVPVIEFFSYGCPWCFRVEPKLEEWLSGRKDIHFTRVPVVFHPEWLLYAKAYYTASVLNDDSMLNNKLFEAVQKEKKNLTTQSAMIDFFVAQGIDKTVAESAFTNSTTINMKVKEGTRLMVDYRITSVPSFVVAGVYKVNLEKAKSVERLFQVIDYLVKKSAA